MSLGFVARGLVQALSVHLVVSLLLSMLVAWTWPRAVERARGPAAQVARRLFLVRIAPGVGGLLTAILTLAGYLVWESRVEAEAVGPWSLACAAGGLALIAVGLGRLIAAIRLTRRIERRLQRLSQGPLPLLPLRAHVIESRFPIVALVGLVVTRLFVARRVIEACSREEIDAILAHESAHARQHDNLQRLAMAAAPDVLSVASGGSALEAAWLRASEFAADESAAAGPAGGLALASALVKVARLATEAVEPVPASALYRGEPITERVHRLLDPRPTALARRWPVWQRTLAAAVVCAVMVATIPALYAAAEALLRIGR